MPKIKIRTIHNAYIENEDLLGPMEGDDRATLIAQGTKSEVNRAVREYMTGNSFYLQAVESGDTAPSVHIVKSRVAELVPTRKELEAKAKAERKEDKRLAKLAKKAKRKAKKGKGKKNKTLPVIVSEGQPSTPLSDLQPDASYTGAGTGAVAAPPAGPDTIN